MKIKLVVIDLELSTRAKRIAAAMAIPLLVLGGAAVAYANVQHTWSDGETLTAADLNGSFEGLDKRITALEQPGVTLTAVSQTVTAMPAQNAWIPFNGNSISLTPGTWLLSGAVTLGQNTPSALQCDGLYVRWSKSNPAWNASPNFADPVDPAGLDFHSGSSVSNSVLNAGISQPAPTLVVTVTQNTPAYLSAFLRCSGPQANVNSGASLMAQRLY